MATDSSAIEKHETKNLRSRHQVLQGAISISAPEPRPQDVICTKWGGRPLEDEYLLDIAESLAKVEAAMVDLVDWGWKSTILSFGDDDEGIKSRDDLQAELNRVQELPPQYELVRQYSESFIITYLSDEKLLRFYDKARREIKEVFNYVDQHRDSTDVDYFKTLLKTIDDELDQTWQLIVVASNKMVLDQKTYNVCRRKWIMIEESSSTAHDIMGTPRRVKTWREIVAKHNISPSVNGRKVSRGHTDRALLTMWLTVLAILCNVATFALAFQYSVQESGTVHDQDFWLLVQSSVMQWFALIIASFSLWPKKHMNSWLWSIPTGVALLCSFIAVPLYLNQPTAWSAFLSTISSAVQAFMTVQLAFVEG